MAVTITDLAEKLGVSTTTVIRALHDRADVSVSTKKRVLDLARELGYRPNIIARGLTTGTSSLLGVIVHNMTYSFISEVVNGIEDVADKYGYSILLATTQGDAEREAKCIKTMRDKCVDGLLLVAACNRPEHVESIREYMREGMNVMTVAYRMEGADIPSVKTDSVEIGRLAASHLVERGHRRIAHLQGELERAQGFRTVLEEYGVYDPALFATTGYTLTESFDITKRLLSMENRPTAIFACDDYVALGVYQAVIASGFSVPGDVAIIGADGLRIGEEVNVPLSTVAQPKYEYGAMACEHIVRMIRGEHVGHTILPVELIVRESSQTKHNT